MRYRVIDRSVRCAAIFPKPLLAISVEQWTASRPSTCAVACSFCARRFAACATRAPGDASTSPILALSRRSCSRTQSLVRAGRHHQPRASGRSGIRRRSYPNALLPGGSATTEGRARSDRGQVRVDDALGTMDGPDDIAAASLISGVLQRVPLTDRGSPWMANSWLADSRLAGYPRLELRR